MAYASLASPFGDITVFAEDGFVVAVEWGRVDPPAAGAGIAAAVEALRRYFDGAPAALAAVAVRPAGSDFQRRVWDRLTAIPWGTTVTYGSLAAELDTAPRAIAAACASNPAPIFIPCHRVIGANGALVGYSGGEGIATKVALLALEGAVLPSRQHSQHGANARGA